MRSIIPTAVVRGLQLGVGLGLAQKGVQLVAYKDAKAGIVRDLAGSESIFLGLFAVRALRLYLTKEPVSS